MLRSNISKDVESTTHIKNYLTILGQYFSTPNNALQGKYSFKVTLNCAVENLEAQCRIQEFQFIKLPLDESVREESYILLKS